MGELDLIKTHKEMKTVRRLPILIFCLTLLLSMSSCAVLVRNDNGRHKGWNKNSNNPHHTQSTNPGHHKEKQKGKHKR